MPHLLDLLASPAPFRAWLTAHSPTDVVGVRLGTRGCPLACFLQAQGIAEPHVDDLIIYAGGSQVVTTPPWAIAFVLALDCAPLGSPQGEVEAGEALALLKDVEEGLREAQEAVHA
jgi:hypothetical protein